MLSTKTLRRAAPRKLDSPPERPSAREEETSAARFLSGQAMRSLGMYCATGLASVVILAVLTQLWRLDLAVPFAYRGDSLLFQSWARTISDHGWYLTNPRLGAPFGSQMYDFPMADNLHFGLLKLISFIDPRWPVMVNVYYLLTFPLSALSALAALRQLGVRGISAAAASLLYAFLPYHWARGEGHLCLAAYYIVPLSILVAVWIYLGRLDRSSGGETPDASRGHRRRLWLSVFVCLLQASAGIYYAYFACFLFVIAGSAAWCHARSLRSFQLPLLLSAITGLGVAANTAPSMIYWCREGTNRNVATRGLYETEVYGLKLAPLILPTQFHILPPLGKLRARYDRSSALFDFESASGTLGAVGSAGFLALLGWTLFVRTQAKKQPLIDALATMNLALVLLAMVGGFGMLVSLLIHPQFRAYSRVSVFIAFLSLAAVAIGLEWLERRWCQPRRRVLFYALLGVLLTLAILDQSPATLRPGVIGEMIARSQFEADAAFVSQIEALLPEGAAVYQLPYVWFPERAGVEKMGDYEHFRPYLHAKTLCFSYGCMRGRAADRWHRTLSDQPMGKVLEAISTAGYAGVYIDRRGYADEAKRLEADLAAHLGQQPLVSGTGEQSFFVLSR